VADPRKYVAAGRAAIAAEVTRLLTVIGAAGGGAAGGGAAGGGP
jgi:hypothetical protein